MVCIAYIFYIYIYMELDAGKIKEYLHSETYNFKIFSMGYTKLQKETIQRFNLNINEDYTHYGQISNIENLNDFLSTIGNNTLVDIKDMENIIISIIQKVLKGYNKKHFWIDIRVTQPNNDYDIPRWHKDGCFFTTDLNETSTAKFVTVMKGPGTLLMKGNTVNKIYKENQHIKNNRFILAKKLINEKIIQIKNSQGLIFYTGASIEKAALHSEPPMDVPRMFISIVPSSKANIIDLQNRWKN